MDHNDAVAIRRQTKIYVAVFGALMMLTLITVTVSYLHLSTPLTIAVALLIATIKGSLVAAYFMHLISERKAIYSILVLTVLFFIVLMIVPSFGNFDQRIMHP
jgi:cytochrome c oxidase subunit 4